MGQTIKDIKDYKRIIGIPEDRLFNSAQFAKLTKLKVDHARKALLVLTEIGIVERVGRNSSGIIYKIAKS